MGHLLCNCLEYNDYTFGIRNGASFRQVKRVDYPIVKMHDLFDDQKQPMPVTEGAERWDIPRAGHPPNSGCNAAMTI